jgi:hypothetical protein
MQSWHSVNRGPAVETSRPRGSFHPKVAGRSLHGNLPVRVPISIPGPDGIATALSGLLKLEGRLVEHEYHAGGRVDLLVLALYRDDFYASKIYRWATTSRPRQNSAHPREGAAR